MIFLRKDYHPVLIQLDTALTIEAPSRTIVVSVAILRERVVVEHQQSFAVDRLYHFVLNLSCK